MSDKYYSGENSKEFWDRIDALKDRHGELYTVGVILQELESRVLRLLESAEEIDKQEEGGA